MKGSRNPTLAILCVVFSGSYNLSPQLPDVCSHIHMHIAHHETTQTAQPGGSSADIYLSILLVLQGLLTKPPC